MRQKALVIVLVVLGSGVMLYGLLDMATGANSAQKAGAAEGARLANSASK